VYEGGRLNPAAARRAALVALWVQVVTLIAYGVYQAIGSSGADLLLNSLDVVLATISLGLWTLLLGDFLRGAMPQQAQLGVSDPRLRVFRAVYPWLIALRAAMWLLTSLALLGGAGDTANPVAVMVLFLVWGGGIVGGLAVYTISAALFAAPGDPAGRARLLTWLNLSAALSVGMTVMNIWPPTGFVPAPGLTDQLIWAGLGILDVLATLLALRAVQMMPVRELAEPPQRN